LYEYYITNLNDRINEESGEEDQLFPDAKFVMDVTFQPIWTPTGTYNEKKLFFSGKHKMYGLKSQCVHDRKGRVIHCILGEKGAVHDFAICRNNIEILQDLLSKEFNGHDSEEEDDSWSILVDSGYQGLQRLVKTVLPHKKQPNRPFTMQQRRYNQELASEYIKGSNMNYLR